MFFLHFYLYLSHGLLSFYCRLGAVYFMRFVCGFGFEAIISCSESFSVSTFLCETTIQEVQGLLLVVAVCQQENDTDIMGENC